MDAASSSQRAGRPGQDPGPPVAGQVGADQAGHPPHVGQHVNRHRAEPQHEARLVQEQPRAFRRLVHGQHHPGAQHAERGAQHHRPEHPEQRGGRPLPPVFGGSGVVPDEPVADRGRLQQHRADQQHAQEEVHRDQLVDGQDGEALGGEQHQQHGAGRRGQPLVPGRAAGPVRPGTVRLERAARGGGRAVLVARAVRAERAPCTARHQITSSPVPPHPACVADRRELVQEPFRTGKEKSDLSRTGQAAGAA